MILNNSYGHGGDVYRNEIAYDFSINVNPFGTPEAIKKAIAETCNAIDIYPDPYCGKLRKKLSEAVGVDEAYILCGNGAAELIYQFIAALKPQKTLLPVPSFSDYEAALFAAGYTPEYYSLFEKDGFALTEQILDEITDETSLLMLCNPNNPSGLCIPYDLLLRIMEKCKKTNTWLFLDECFLGLSDEKKSCSLIPELLENDNIFILRAFTKLYGMAGVRLGYAVCKNTELLKKMCNLVQPWNVSSLAQAAGIAALDCCEWAANTKQKIFEEKQYFIRELQALGIAVLPSDANFLLLSGVPTLYQQLLEKKILIRSCENYRGLHSGYCRVAVRTHEENKALVAALREIYHG